MSAGHPGLPVAGGEPRQVAAVVNRLNQGKINCTGAVTLAAGVPSTSVTDGRAGGASVVLLMPVTANAAAEIGNGTLYVASRSKGSFVIAHANNGQTDRSFEYVVIA